MRDTQARGGSATLIRVNPEGTLPEAIPSEGSADEGSNDVSSLPCILLRMRSARALSLIGDLMGDADGLTGSPADG